MDYFCALDQNGQRHDIAQHPELTQGSVEYLAPQEYMVRHLLFYVQVANDKNGAIWIDIESFF